MKGLQENPSPFTIEELLKIVLVVTDEADLKNTTLVSKLWYVVSLQMLPIKRLTSRFHIHEAIVKELKSPALVYERLSKIVQRSKVRIFNEHTLYRLYCNNRAIHAPFIHFLDNNITWFEQYFSKKDTFFLECIFKYACMIGNDELVQFFIKNKGLKPLQNHVNLAASSGQLPLVKYLLEDQPYALMETPKTSIFYETLISGSVELFHYIKERFKWQPKSQDFNTAVMSGSYELVKQLHEEYAFEASDVTLLAIEYSRNLNIFFYLVSILNWTPQVKGVIALAETVYSMGIPAIIQYAQRQFSFDITKLKLINNAIDSQNFSTFIDLCNTLNITKDNVYAFIENGQLTMLKALNSGNLDIVKHLKESYGLAFESRQCLTYATESGNPDLLDYVLNTNQFKISTKEISIACQFGSLEFLSTLYKNGHEFLPADMGCHCFTEDNLMRLYHLLENEHYKACDVLLFNVIMSYKQYNDDKNIFYHFVEYLIGTHTVQPTAETIMAVGTDTKMLAILYGNPVKEAENCGTICRLV